jgi:hypothetical protein
VPHGPRGSASIGNLAAEDARRGASTNPTPVLELLLLCPALPTPSPQSYPFGGANPFAGNSVSPTGFTDPSGLLGDLIYDYSNYTVRAPGNRNPPVISAPVRRTDTRSLINPASWRTEQSAAGADRTHWAGPIRPRPATFTPSLMSYIAQAHPVSFLKDLGASCQEPTLAGTS